MVNWNRRVVGSAALCMVVLAPGCAGDEPDPAAALPSVTSLPTPSSSTASSSAAGSAAGEMPPPDLDPEQAMLQFQRCMADQGVPIADTGIVGDDGGTFTAGAGNEEQDQEQPSPEALEQAQLACQPYLDASYGDFELSPEQEAELADANLAMERCLRAMGYDVDVDASGTMQLTLGADQSPQEYEAALRECAE